MIQLLLLASLCLQDASALVRQLDDDSFEVRSRAEKELLKLGPAARAALLESAKSARGETLERINAMLARITEEAGRPAGSDVQPVDEAPKKPDAAQEMAIRALIERLDEEDIGVREKAVEELALLGDIAIALLEVAAKSANPQVKAGAEAALARPRGALIWSVGVKASGRTPESYAPVVAGGRVIAAHLGRIVAVDVATGTQAWELELPQAARGNVNLWHRHRVAAPLQVTGGIAWFATANRDSYAGLYAVDAATGKVAWETTIHRALGPVACETTMVTVEMRKGNQGWQHLLVARDIKTGKETWISPVEVAEGATFAELHSVSGLVLMTTSDEKMRAFDAATGKPLWTQRVAKGRRLAPVLEDSRLFAAGPANTLLAIDPKTGQTLWMWQGREKHAAAPQQPAIVSIVVAGGIVYASDSAGWLVAIHAKTGKLGWERENLALLSVARGLVFAAGESCGSTLFALDPATGKDRWSYACLYLNKMAPAMQTITAPTAIGRAVLFTSGLVILGVDVATGKPLGQWGKAAQVAMQKVANDVTIGTVDDTKLSALVHDRGRIFIQRNDGVLLAVR